MRCTRVSDSTLARIGYVRGQAVPELVSIAAAVANRQSKILWILLALIILLSLVLIVVSLIVNGSDNFLTAPIRGREGGFTTLAMILVAVGITICAFLIAIWYQRVRARNVCEDLCELLPRCTEVPVTLSLKSEPPESNFAYSVNLSVTSDVVPINNRSWYILNSCKNLWQQQHDTHATEKLAQMKTESATHDGTLLVDSDGEPLALLVSNTILWPVSTKFLSTAGLNQNAQLEADLVESKTQLRKLLRSTQ